MNKWLRDLFYGKGAFDPQPLKKEVKKPEFEIKQTPADVAVMETPKPSKEWTERQEQIELVKLIHAEFNDEMQNILKEMSIVVPTKTEHQASLDRAEALKRLGFASALEVAKLDKFNKENARIMAKNAANAQVVEDLKTFSQKYPMYKFITRASLDRICKKYGLHYASVRYFTGVVPQANLQALLDCSIAKKDIPKLCETSTGWNTRAELELSFANEHPHRDKIHERAPLIIAAPFKEFSFPTWARIEETESGQVKFRIKEDPIVMQPVYSGENTYFAIITAWGPEASDPEVINPRNN